MFAITIVFGPSPVPWVFMFHKEEDALTAWASLENETGIASISDDFGQRAVMTRTNIHGAMLEDMEKSKLAHIERGLHQARTQARAQTLAQADPALRTAAMGNPAIHSPFPNGRFQG